MTFILFCPDLLTYWLWFSQSDASVIIKGEFSVPMSSDKLQYDCNSLYMLLLQTVRHWPSTCRIHDSRDRQTPSLLLHVRMNDTQSPLLCRFVRYCFLRVCVCVCVCASAVSQGDLYSRLDLRSFWLMARSWWHTQTQTLPLKGAKCLLITVYSYMKPLQTAQRHSPLREWSKTNKNNLGSSDRINPLSLVKVNAFFSASSTRQHCCILYTITV